MCYNNAKKANRSKEMARKSRYIEKNKLKKEENNMTKIGIYTRLSEADGDNCISESIKNQIALTQSYIEGLSDAVCVKTYIDDGYTGLNFERPGFHEMMADITSGVINCVIVKDISRLGRNYIELGVLLAVDFKRMKVRFISINNQYDSINDSDDLPGIGLILQTVADNQVSKDTSKKVSSSISGKISCGEFIPSSSSIPYGYLRDSENNTYAIDDETFIVVRKIYSMRADNSSISAIVNYLNAENVPSPGKLRYMRGMTTDEKLKESQWNRTTVRKILNDVSYIGNRVHGRKKKETCDSVKKRTSEDEWIIIENAHPTIISKELFDKVQAVNNNELQKLAKQEMRAQVESDYREILRGKLFCADCGSAMLAKKSSAKTDSNTSSYIYYECSKYYSDHSSCNVHYIREDLIVSKIIYLLNHYADRCLSTEYQKSELISHKNNLVNIRKEILSIRSQKDSLLSNGMSLYEQYASGKITAESFKAQNIRNKNKIIELEEKEKILTTQMDALDDKVDEIEMWIKHFKEFKKTENLTKEVIDRFINTIKIKKGQSLVIDFKFNKLNIIK